MSNPTTYGLTSVVYGNPATYSGFVVQATSLDLKDGVTAVVLNESGQQVCRRYDDQINELSLDLIVNGGTQPIPGQTLVYNTVTYEIVTSSLKTSNKEFEKVNVKCMNSANMAS